jgi:hypothetical protein
MWGKAVAALIALEIGPGYNRLTIRQTDQDGSGLPEDVFTIATAESGRPDEENICE